MRASLLIGVLAVLGGCSFPEYTLIDGQGTPFGCAGAPTPTTADNPIVFSGTVAQSTTLMPINNAAIAGQLGTTQAFTANTDAMGKFSKSLNTGNAPLTIFLATSANGFKNTYYYPPYVVTHDAQYNIELFSPQDANTLASAAQITYDPTKGIILMSIDDCNDMPLKGATVNQALLPTGAVVHYFDRVTPSATATSTDMYGVAMVSNLAPGNVQLSANVNGMALKTLNIQVVADAFIQTQIQP